MTEHFDTASPLSAAPKRPLKFFLCHTHIIPLRDADRDAMKALYDRLTTPPRRVGAGDDGVNAWLDK